MYMNVVKPLYRVKYRKMSPRAPQRCGWLETIVVGIIFELRRPFYGIRGLSRRSGTASTGVKYLTAVDMLGSVRLTPTFCGIWRFGTNYIHKPGSRINGNRLTVRRDSFGVKLFELSKHVVSTQAVKGHSICCRIYAIIGSFLCKPSVSLGWHQKDHEVKPPTVTPLLALFRPRGFNVSAGPNLWEFPTFVSMWINGFFVCIASKDSPFREMNPGGGLWNGKINIVRLVIILFICWLGVKTIVLTKVKTWKLNLPSKKFPGCQFMLTEAMRYRSNLKTI